ncbi:MAG: hypothetical protein VW709_17885, partial [Rickettsiales bacterium]
AVIDQNISMGKGGVLHTEVSSILAGIEGAPRVLSFIGGLGGRDIGEDELLEIARLTEEVAAGGDAPRPRLLYSEDELKQIRKLQAIAAAEQNEPEVGP